MKSVRWLCHKHIATIRQYIMIEDWWMCWYILKGLIVLNVGSSFQIADKYMEGSTYGCRASVQSIVIKPTGTFHAVGYIFKHDFWVEA